MKKLLLVSLIFLATLGFAQINNGGGGGGSSAYNAITSGTNTSATMTNGSGSTTTYSGTGILNASNSPFLLTAFPVTAYGAKCDGSTDDSTAIQAADTAAEAAGFGTVIFPKGTCNYSTTLTIQGGVRWIGQANDYTILMDTTAGNDFLDITGPSFANSITYGSIQNIAFLRSVAFTGSPNGIKLTNVGYWDIDHVDVWDSSTGFNCVACKNDRFKYSRYIQSKTSTTVNAYFIQVGDSTYIEDSDSIESAGPAITNSLNISGSAGDIWVERFNVAANGGVVSLTGSLANPSTQDVHFNQLIVETSSAGAAVQISGVTGNQCGLNAPCQITFVDSHIANSIGPAILCTGCQGVSFTQSDIRCPATGTCVSFTGAGSLNDRFNDNWVRTIYTGSNNPTLLGVSSGVKNSTFNNNQFFGTSNAPFTTCIAVTGSTNNQFQGNTCSGNGTTGISLDATSTGNQLVGNNIDPTAITTQISDLSGGSVSGNSSLSGQPFFLDPTKYTFFFDDFTSGQSLTAASAVTAYVTGGMNLTWVMSTPGANGTIDIVHPTDSGTNGVVVLNTGTASGNFIQLFSSEFVAGTSIAQSTFTTLNNTTFDIRFRGKISTTATITWKIGFADPLGTSEIGIAYDTTASDTIWKAVCNNAGTSTRSSITGSTLDTNYHDFRMRSTTAGTVLFSVDGGTEVSINTNLPTVNMSPRITLATQTTASESTRIDYIWGWIAITR